MFLNRQNSFLFLILAVSVGYLVSAMSLGAPVAESGLTPSFFPILVGAAAILFSPFSLCRTGGKHPEKPHPTHRESTPTSG